jgi:glycosyltransferase involved in cell wall biosynthesis/GT2 family glycosyltransferase
MRQLRRLDAVMFHAFEPYMSAVFRSFAARKPLLVWSQDNPPLSEARRALANYGGTKVKPDWRRRWRFWFDIWCARRVALFFPFSHWAGDILSEDCGISPERVHPINVGLDLELWPYLPAETVSKRPKILFVGGDFTRKGGDLLLECYRHHFTDSAELHLVTRQPPPDLPPHVSVYTDLQANDPRLRQLYAECDVFVLPTRADMSPWVILEAMATGRPVIATRTGGIPDMVQDGKTGFLIEPGDGALLTERLRTLLSDAELRRCFGAAGRERVECEFNAAVCVPRILEIMKRAVDAAVPTGNARMLDNPLLIAGNQGAATTVMTTTAVPPVTALVCTRNRGDSIRLTIETLLQSDYPDFEVIVVDQSTEDATANALRMFEDDPRFRYIPSQTKGLGRARNIGIAAAHSDLIIMTDDDCEVPPDWLTVMAEGFAQHPNVAVVYSNVVAGPHDVSAGFVPIYIRQGEQLMTRVSDKCADNGIGAAMAVRRSVIEKIGGFDEMLGAGARFTSYEDVDIALRALLRGYYVFETDRTAVVHHGFRTMHEGRELTLRNYYGIGAGLGKLFKCRQWGAGRVASHVLWTLLIAPTLSHLIRLRKPPVLRRYVGFTRGFLHALRTPVDRAQLQFKE